MLAQDATIVMACRDWEHDERQPAVPPFELHASLHVLEVV